jgi:hypothetical protein
MRAPILSLAAAALAVVSSPAAHAEDALAAALEKLSKDQIAAFNREDLAATMSYAHTRAPDYAETRAELGEQFSELDAKAEQLSFQFVGHDDEFAVARVKVKVTAPGTEGFDDNVVDTLTLFHQEGGSWKLWDVYVLGSTFLE